jgi:acetyl-CoA carboxylase biotin carboxyl carrier protein
MSEKIKAPLTGTVWKIETTVGAKVDEGDTLIILESMKMEIPVEAPFDGTITAIHVTEGASVLDGLVLIEMEES